MKGRLILGKHPDCNINIHSLRARSHLATVTKIFDVVSMSSEMVCIVTTVTKPMLVVKCEWTLN